MSIILNQRNKQTAIATAKNLLLSDTKLYPNLALSPKKSRSPIMLAIARAMLNNVIHLQKLLRSKILCG